MILVSVPLRVGFGSSDHIGFADIYGGNALNFSIDKHIYLLLRKRNNLEESRYRVSYSKTELCNDVNEIKHPLVREAIKMVGVDDPLEIIYSSDVPAKTGLATSSAMVVGLLKGLYYYKNVGISKDILVERAYRLEREIVGNIGGHQDAFPCVFGGMQYLTGSAYNVKRTPVPLDPERSHLLNSHLLLLYTNSTRESQDVLAEQLVRLKKAETLDETMKIKKIVEEMWVILSSPSFSPMDLAYPMREAWELKKKLSSSITTSTIKKMELEVLRIYDGAGIRLVGAGGRGMLMVLCPPEYHEQIKTALVPFKDLPFKIEWEGSKVRKLYE